MPKVKKTEQPADPSQVDTITTGQLKKLLQIGENRAQKIMNGIKSVSDTMDVDGVCHKQDYEAWLAVRCNKPSRKFRSREGA